MGNPLYTYAGVLERAPHMAHLYLFNDSMVAGYRFYGGPGPDDVYGNPYGSGCGGTYPELMFEVNRGDMYRSPTLRRRGLGRTQENHRGTTHAAFDIDDFRVPGTIRPKEEQWLFLRVQENRPAAGGYLYYAGIPQATVTLAGVLAGDQLEVKGVIFQFQAGVNDLVGKAGTLIDPFLVGLGASDDDAAGNLTVALNDAGDVYPVMYLLAPVDTSTGAANVGAPSAVVLIQPLNIIATPIPGSLGQFSISSTDNTRVNIDAIALAESRLVWTYDVNTPVLGPIYCVPPASTYGMPSPAFTLGGRAPQTSCVAGAVPVIPEAVTDASGRPMHLVFPVPIIEITITNHDLAVGLLVSFGPGQIMQEIPAGGELQFFSGGGAKDVVLSGSSTNTIQFSLHGILGRG